jgi:hypothetical protein
MNPAEEAFVNTFVRRDRRERALFELSSESKRGKFLNRLCHEYAGVFDARYLRPIPEAEDCGSVFKLLRESGAAGTCHVISCNEAVDGRQLLLEEAIRATVGFGFPSVLICAPDSLAYFEAEQEKGAPPRFLLVKNRDT